MDELPLPAKLPVEEPPQLPADMISQIDKFLSNPLFQIAAKSHAEDIQKFIKENAKDFEPLVYDYINSKYPNIYTIIKPDEERTPAEDKPEVEPDDPEVIEKPMPQAALNFEIFEMYKDGYSATEIADFLSEKYDINLYAMHCGRIIKRMQAAIAAQKPKDEIGIKPTITQATRTQTPAEASTPKQIDPDMLLVVSSAASLINFWNNIKFYVYMSLAGLAGALIERAIILR